MSQDFAAQELLAKPPSTTTTSGTTGSTCQKTGPYKATDGKIEFIVYFATGDVFSYFPGGSGNKKCTWNKLSKTTDGSKQSFEGVLVPAGTL